MEKKYVEILLHELSHQVGAPDHYCYGKGSSGRCANLDCDMCYKGHDKIGLCVMEESQYFWTETDMGKHCSGCRDIINKHLQGHHSVFNE